MSEALPSPRPSTRVEFIDLLRGWAVLVMIETHVVNATLAHELMSGAWLNHLKFLNGLVAPSFLFASGMAYAYTTHRKVPQYLSFGQPLFKQLGRLVLILVIAYMLHLPQFSFAVLVHETTWEEWQPFFQADVLQCIAVTLLFLQALLLALRTEKRLYLTVGVIGGGVLLATPLVWGMDFEGRIPAPVAAYLNGNAFSQFPLFPWSVFIFAGAVAGYLYATARDAEQKEGRNATSPMMWRLLLAAGGMVCLSVVIEPYARSLYPTYDYWRFSPSFVLLRLGLVMMLCWGLFFYEQRRGVSPRSWITLAGRESLIVYVVHLLLLYGDFATFNFEKRVNHSFGFAEAAATTIILVGLMVLLAWGWSRAKSRSLRFRRTVSGVIVLALLLVFLFGPAQ